MTDGYDRKFYRDLDTTAQTSAREIVPMILDLVKVGSVVDVGCGDGGWLSIFKANGVDDIIGIDGPWIDDDLLKIAKPQFRRSPLDELLPIERRFDLSMSLEVAEHLPPEKADQFVAELTRLAPIVLFAAAVPGQGGLHHVNEQWPGYWTARFAAHGYRPIDAIRLAVWNRASVTWWYKQNTLLFATPAAIDANPRLAAAAAAAPSEPPALIHPDLFRMTLRAAQPRVGRWIKMAPDVMRRTLRSKKKRP
jgi:SAM-dependent methyltransferase